MTDVTVAGQSHSLGIAREQLEEIFLLKYGHPSETGWGPRTRWRAGHFNPDDHYEALVNTLVTSGCRWIDVGCGSSVDWRGSLHIRGRLEPKDRRVADSRREIDGAGRLSVQGNLCLFEALPR